MSQSNLTRRQFAKAAAAGAVTAAAPTAPAAAAQPEPATDAQALYELLRLRYGKHLDAEQLKRVQASVDANLRMAARLRKFPVGQDDPAVVFMADVP